jgi:hypothetical protein
VRIHIAIRRVDVEQKGSEVTHARGGGSHVCTGPVSAHPNLEAVREELRAKSGGSRVEGKSGPILQSDWRR